MLNKVFQQLDEDGKADLKAYLALIEGYAPSVQSGLTAYMSESDKVIVADDDPAKLADIVEAKNYIRRFLSNGFAKEEVKEIILGMPNYKYIENELMKVFEEENYD
jgi:hypothetical protein